MNMAMALHNKHLLLLFLPLFATLFLEAFTFDKARTYPFNCSANIQTCNSSLYHTNDGLSIEELAFYYSVNTSQIKPITHTNKQDYLVTVPCSCKDVNGTKAYFYDVLYRVKANDTFYIVTSVYYNRQAWEVGDEEQSYKTGEYVPVHLLCGCIETKSQIVVTYTVQDHDTLTDIVYMLYADVSEIESMNPVLTQNPSFIDVGWILYVPMDKNMVHASKTGKKNHKWTIILGLVASFAVLSMCTVLVILLRRKKYHKDSEEDPKSVSKSTSTNRTFSSRRQNLQKAQMEDVSIFDSEKPLIYTLKEIQDATNNFDESKKLGEGGYGSVYYGMLGKQEVAIKKMRSNKSKEFFAELKVLCRIHHINVVELLGYASGEDHLYLVYEFMQNGSLSDHLHDPLLKGYQPLSWSARAQIALDAARGIEYVHDHTKAQYVHRDIKTSNILLDEGLRAKVADFGLAKLVDRTNEEEYIATRLVGTPGYLPPESVKELQVTIKTDVFAFGVVLAELITGQRALIRDNREPTRMKSLVTVIFRDEEPEAALEVIIDGNLKGNYPMEDVYKMAEIAELCLSEDAIDRPEMREIVVSLNQIVASSVEWEASLGGESQIFSSLFSGR
ncbi:Serine-threonine/tyrosine-protein kinase, catalytic domain [Dillenia turbinata]|uniref:Serine-threonine/tyrosine-protein kinase, catalytic domain n=1 Tax=Dillenia turbinata TaxID=194707 RepID=A0AAN8ZAR5_9MAGN